MTAAAQDGDRPKVLVSYDGSSDAANALTIGGRLLPVRPRGPRVGAAIRECGSTSPAAAKRGQPRPIRRAARARRCGHAAGWQAELLAHRGYGAAGFELARLADEPRPAAVVVGSRGLGGAQAVLGSVSNMVAHYSPAPVTDRAAPSPRRGAPSRRSGSGRGRYDESDGARRALAAAAPLFPGRELIAVTVPTQTSPARAPTPPRSSSSGRWTARPRPGGGRRCARPVRRRAYGRAPRRWLPGTVGVARDRARKCCDGRVAPCRPPRPHRGRAHVVRPRVQAGRTSS